MNGVTQQGTSQPGTMQPRINQPGVAQTGMARSQLAFHETMELHELLNLKTVCMVQSKLMSGVVFDPDLKALLEKDVQQSMTAISQLESVYSAGPDYRDGV